MIKILTSEYRKTFWFVSLIAVFLVALYFILVSSSVFNAVSLKEAESKMAGMRGELSVLESKFIKLDSKIDSNLVNELGFVDMKNNTYTYAGLTSSVSRSN